MAKDMIAILARLDPDQRYRYSAETAEIIGEKYQWYLANLYRKLSSADKRERLAYLERFLYESLNPEPITDMADAIVPRLKSRFEYQLMLQALDNAQSLPAKSISASMVCILAIDKDTSVQMLGGNDLVALELSEAEAFKQAVAKLNRISDAPFKAISPGLYRSRFGDDHDAARLLLVDQIQELPVKGDPVAVAVSNAQLLISGADDPKILTVLSKICEEIATQERLLSLQPLRLVDGQWQDFIAEKKPDYAGIYNLVLLERNQNYELQKEHWDTEQSDWFIATHQLSQEENSPFYIDSCIWSEGVPTLLAKTEQLIFVEIIDGKAEVMGLLPWHIVMAEFGELLTLVADTIPPRYQVQSFPDKQRLLGLFGGASS